MKPVRNQHGAIMIGMVAVYMAVGAIQYAAMQSTESNIQKTIQTSLSNSLDNRQAENVATLIELQMQMEQVVGHGTLSGGGLQFDGGAMPCNPQQTPALTLKALTLMGTSGINGAFPASSTPLYTSWCIERVVPAGPSGPYEYDYDLLVQKMSYPNGTSSGVPVGEYMSHLTLNFYGGAEATPYK